VTTQIKSHTEYSVQTYNILVLILYSKLMKNVSSLVFEYDLMANLDSGLLFGHPA